MARLANRPPARQFPGTFDWILSMHAIVKRGALHLPPVTIDGFNEPIGIRLDRSRRDLLRHRQARFASYFSSAAVEVPGPSPTISSTASSSLAPSQCTCLPKWVTKLPAGIAVVLAGSNFGPEPTHQVPCSTVM